MKLIEKIRSSDDIGLKLDRYESENRAFRQALYEIRKYCKEESEYWGVDDYIFGLNKGCDTTKKDILQIMYKHHIIFDIEE